MRIMKTFLSLSLFVFMASCGEEEGSDATNASAPATNPNITMDGTITAMLDGEERTWYVTSGTMQGQFVSQSDFRDMGMIGTSVTILGHATSNTVIGSKEAIIMTFTVHNKDSAPRVERPEIAYLSGGMMKRHTTDDGGAAELTVTSASVDGELLNIAGTFSGSLVYSTFDGSPPENGKQTMTLSDGTFDVKVHPPAE